MRLLHLICSLTLVTPAVASPCDYMEAIGTATPFVCHGQTTIPPNLQITNPPTNTGQVNGECPALPYIVPAGRTLIVDSMHLEGSGYGSGMFLFVGTTASAGDAMTSIESAETPPAQQSGQYWQPSIQFTGLNWWFAPGTQINVMLNDAEAGTITAWDFAGCLK